MIDRKARRASLGARERMKGSRTRKEEDEEETCVSVSIISNGLPARQRVVEGEYIFVARLL